MQLMARNARKTGYLMTILLLFFLAGCTSIPDGVTPVNNFQKDKYLGTWYEIARLDHSFERGLEQVTASYSVKTDGGIKVLNKGYNTEEGVWDEAEGKAYFVAQENVGHLKVSFFGPFYASYIIASLSSVNEQEQYEYALITGPDTDYLWILSRTPVLQKDVLNELVSQAKEYGFATEKLIYVKQTQE